jgi:uncharacterized protein (TIGR01777 family)
MRALVTGATGFIGRALVKRLAAPRVLSRDAAAAKASLGGVQAFPWPGESAPIPVEATEGLDAVFHLAGENVAARRWSAAQKRRIRESRVFGTRTLVAALGAAKARPKVLVAASAVGFYGDRGEETLAEDAEPGADFLARTCVEWEEESRKAEAHGIRVVRLRLGVVLGKGGGALAKMLFPFKLGVGGVLGDGRQWMPWIHLDDVVGLALHAAADGGPAGALNAVGPAPATNREFTKALGRVLHRPTILPAPRFGMRIVFGEFADILFASQKVVPRAALASGYRFAHGDVESALRASV